MKEEQLVFIISQPRSGSTLLQNYLSNNSDVNTCSEPWILLNHLNFFNPDLASSTVNNDFAAAAFQAYKQEQGEELMDQLIKDSILSLYSPMANGFNIVLDKTPRYWEIILQIARFFPKAKIVVLKRNPLDVLRSMCTTWKMRSFRELLVFRRDLVVAPKRLHNFLALHRDNNNVYSLRYEDLVDNPESEVRSLYSWLGISFIRQVLNISDNQKFKGRFGDPYQNASTNYEAVKTESTEYVLPKQFNKLIQGYASFLGSDFLKEYGDYKESKEIRPKKTWAWRYFQSMSSVTTANNTSSSGSKIMRSIWSLFYK